MPRLASFLIVATAGVAALQGAAGAATVTTTTAPKQNPQVQNFCSQIRNSQTSIASATGTTAEKNRRIGLEWGKIEKVAPPAIKSQVTTIKAAYVKAATQADAAAATTLAGIAAAGQKVTSFVSSNCGNGNGGGPGNDGDGPRQMDPARLAEIQACFKKEGVTFPTPGQGGEQPNFQDPKFQAAAQKCGFGGRGPGGGGFGGRGGLSDAVRACLAKKGITLPAPGQRPNGTATTTTKKGAAAPSTTAPGNGQVRNRQGGGQFDEKTRAAIEACRAANP